ncbi:MAG TPA: phosphotransferase [Acidimicrobiia bacterium]|nr:phosphotransferase [Acidimicrobiia bacterium]
MTARSESPPAPEGLAAALEPALGAPVEIAALQRLTGGASRETWAFTANGEECILRRDPPGRPGAPGAMRREADAMRACVRAGLRAPEVLVDDDGTRLGTAGLVMRRVPGETIARRILRDAEFAGARRVLVRDLGRFLAGLHALDPASVPGAESVADPLGSVWEKYLAADDRSATFERAHEWLVANRPPPSGETLVHGDLRMGNVIVDSAGLAAAIDWELVHRGDPLEDLAWLCLKAWRFGEPLEVGGLGTVDELVAAYEGAGGRPVDRRAFHWWLVEKTLTWGIGCMLQASIHLSGRVRSVELAAVGRRVAEQEWDLVELLAPDARNAALAAPPAPAQPDDPARYGRPTARELLDAVREFLTREVMPSTDTKVSFHARVAANALGIVERELAQQPVERPTDDWTALALAVRDRLAVANPKYLAASRATVVRRPPAPRP